MATAHKSRVLDMTQGDPFRLVLQFSMPLFCSNLLQQLYNLTDTALAGHLLGSAALAEIGATAALYGLIMNFAFGMNNGLALTVSRYFGAGDESGIRRAVGWMVTLSAAVSLVLTGCSLLGRDALLTVLQVPAQAWGGASAYLTVILLGIPLTMLYNMEAALLRAVGNSVTPLLFLLFSSVLNVGLDAAFMGPLGLGVRGAAIATVLAQGISAVLGVVYILRGYPELRFTPRQLGAATRRAVTGMFWAGLSMGLMSAIYKSGQRGAAKQHQRAGQRLHHGADRRAPLSGAVLYPGRCAGHRRGDVQQPESGCGPPQPHLAERQGRACDLFCVVGVCDGVHLPAGRGRHPRHHGQHGRGHYLQRAAVPENQRTGHPADGRAGHSAQYAAGHPAHGRAAAGQRAGACGQGDLCRMARAGPGLPRGLLL